MGNTQKQRQNEDLENYPGRFNTDIAECMWKRSHFLCILKSKGKSRGESSKSNQIQTSFLA